MQIQDPGSGSCGCVGGWPHKKFVNHLPKNFLIVRRPSSSSSSSSSPSSYFGKSKFENPKIKKKTKTETKAGEPARGARSALPVGRFTRFVSVFVFVLIFGFSNFDFPKYDDDDDDDDDEDDDARRVHF